MSLEFERTASPEERFDSAEVDTGFDPSFGDMDLEGEELGSWLLEERLGAGGIGEVYRATHMHLELSAAIKLPHTRLADNELQLERFRREALAMMQCKHPNVIAAKEFAIDETHGPYLVMELLEGMDMAKCLDEQGGTLPWSWCKAILLQLCDALQEIHSQGFIHRDIKPSNLFLLFDEELPKLKLLDFGTTKITFIETDQALTTTGMIVGTPLYLAPEQLQSASKLTPATDIYAAGVVLYQALAGVPPLEGKTLFEQLIQVSQLIPPRLGDMQSTYRGTGLEALLEEFLAKDPSARPQSAKEAKQRLLEAFEDYERSAPTPPSQKPVRRLSTTYAFTTETPESTSFSIEQDQRFSAVALDVTPDMPSLSSLMKQEPTKLSTSPGTPLTPKPPKKLQARPWAWVVAVLLLALGGMGSWYLLSSRSSRPAPKQTVPTRPTVAAKAAATTKTTQTPERRSFLDNLQLRIAKRKKAPIPRANPPKRKRRRLAKRRRSTANSRYPAYQKALKAFKKKQWRVALQAFKRHIATHEKRASFPQIKKQMKACRCALKEPFSWEICEATDYPPGVGPNVRR